MALLNLLMVLGLLLTLVTLVGHGIWVLVSSIFGGSRRPRTPISKFDALSELRGQVEDFAQQGLLDQEARMRLAAAIDEQEQRLAAIQTARAVTPTQAAVGGVSDAEVTQADVGGVSDAEVTPVAPPAIAAREQPPADLAPVPLSTVAPSEPLPLTPLPIGERARKYHASREAATSALAAESDDATDSSSKPAKPREALSRLLAAFMEENNIRWGELVGGLLIVGCSIALVISLWSQIAARPLLKFVLFNGVTASLFGVGMYTDRRWKIRTTSHGVLVIATLLVPLNFLAIAAFTQASPPTDFLSLAGEAVSFAVFSSLVYLAGRILVPGNAVLLAVGVMFPCLMQLVVRRFAHLGLPLAGIYALAAAPVLSYLATAIRSAHRHWNADDVFNESPANRQLVFLGLTSAATLMPLALLLYIVPPPQTTLHWLSPLVALCGLPALQIGLLFARRFTGQSTGLQTAGIGVGVLGAMLMVAAIVLAWPDPATLLPTALATAAATLVAAVWFGIPAAHVPAGLALAAAWLLGIYRLRGDVGWTIDDSSQITQLLLSATSGQWLLPIVAAFGGVAWWLRRRKLGEPSRMYGLVTAATAVASLALVFFFGFARFGDPSNISWTLVLYAVATLAAAAVLVRVGIARIGSALLLAALIQIIVYRYGAAWQLAQPWVVAFLSHASTITIGCIAFARWAQKFSTPSALLAAQRVQVIRALLWSALATSIVGAVWMAATIHSTSYDSIALHAAWLAGLWMAIAAILGSPALFTISQAALILSIFFGVTAAVAGRDWYLAARHAWLDPWFLELQGIAIAAYCLLFGVVRWLLGRFAGHADESAVEAPPPTWWRTADRLFNPPWPAVALVAEVAVVLLLALLATYAVVPGIAQELSPTSTVGSRTVPPIEQFQIAAIDHRHASDRGGWLLLAAVAATLAAGWRFGGPGWRILGLAMVAMAACSLLAARWEPQVAVASALRWLSAGLFAVASIGIWTWQHRAGGVADADSSSHGAPRLSISPSLRDLRTLLLAFVSIIYAAMGVYVAQAALMLAGGSPESRELWPWTLVWAVVAGIIGIAVPFAGAERAESLRDPSGARSTWSHHARNVLLLLAFAPLAIVLAFDVARALARHPLVGPEPGTWFRQIGWDGSYGIPLAVIALVCVGHAIRDRSNRFAFAAGLLFNVVATIVVLIRLARGGAPLDAAAWITVAQVNAIVAGVVAIVWLAVMSIHRAATGPKAEVSVPTWPMLLMTQGALAATLCATFLLPAAVHIALEKPPAAWSASADGPFGWSALALATAAVVWLQWRRGVTQNGTATFVAALIAIVAATVAQHWDNGNWQAFHTLLTGATLAACLLPVVARGADLAIAGADHESPPLDWAAPFVRSFAVAAVLLTILFLGRDPGAPWWAVAALVAISGRNVWIAWYHRRRGAVWLAALLFLPAMSILWVEWADKFSPTTKLGGFGQACEFLWVNVLAATLMALISVWIERCRLAPIEGDLVTRRGIGFHRFAAWAIVATLLLTTGAGLIADFNNRPFVVSEPIAWIAWLAAAVTAFACLWDPAVRWSVPCLYLVGLIAVGLYLDRLNLQAPMIYWALANALAAYSLATSALWSVRERLRATVARLGVPVAASNESAAPQATWHEGSGHGWLVPVNILMGVFVLLLVWQINFTIEDFMQRMVAAYAVGAQAFAIGLLARGAVRTSLQYLALVWGVLFAIAFGWSFLPLDIPAPWLHRLVVIVAALAATIVVYGFGLVKFLKRENEWTRAAARLVPVLVALAAAIILAVLVIEVRAFAADGMVPIAPAALVTVALALLGLTVAALIAALVPGRDPLGLSERGRTVYIYAAEALLGLLFLHIRVTMPWLFHGWFLRFWPLVVMVLAFLGVGIGEFFQRRRQRILSEPLQTTGAILPLLPALGFWIMSSQVHYSLLLLSIGVLYAALSALRQSFWYGMLAALAANGSLWYLLHQREGLSLMEHPQLWLIPPALSALAAGYINRERLTQQQSATLRIASAIAIYASSTADVFINGVADAPWLPAVLAGLSILGVLAGIMFRVQSFLYLGVVFLVVALMTVIWHAAINEQHTEILWIAGIITGILIIALFGVFEKRRDDVLRVVEELKHWHA